MDTPLGASCGGGTCRHDPGSTTPDPRRGLWMDAWVGRGGPLFQEHHGSGLNKVASSEPIEIYSARKSLGRKLNRVFSCFPDTVGEHAHLLPEESADNKANAAR